MPKTFLKFLEPYEAELVGKGLQKKGPIIAVSGAGGSGKSEAVRLILGAMPQLTMVYAGGIFRNMAEKAGMSVEEFSGARPKDVDYEIDRWMLSKGAKGSAVVDAHLAAWVMGKWADARILVTCPLELRIRRVALRENVTESKAAGMISSRDAGDAKHYKSIYGVDIGDRKVYTHVIDNSGSAEQLRQKVLEALKGLK